MQDPASKTAANRSEPTAEQFAAPPDATPAPEALAWLLDPSAPRPKTGLAALVDLWEREAQAPGAAAQQSHPGSQQ